MKKLVNILMIILLLGNIVLLSYFAYRLYKNYDAEVIEEVNDIKEDEVDEPVEDATSVPNDNMETFFGVTIDYKQSPSYINSIEDINLRAMDEYNFLFDYNNQSFQATYSYDNWTIYDSYRVKNVHDMTIICQGLIDIYPVHGSDRISYRNADDMAYEWLQHNYAYELLPESNFKQMAKDVDFDPDDQGKSLQELYQSRR